VVRPTSTFPEEIRSGSGTGEIVDTEAANIREYQALLIDNLIQLGVDEKLASEVGAKANKYFMTELGTADDRLRQRMLQGEIEPQVWHGDDSNWSRKMLDRINKPLIGARRGNAEARRKFEGAYDRATGVQRTIVGDDLSPHSSDIPAAVSEADQMLQEGSTFDLITNTMGGFGHDPLSLYPQLTYTMAEAREQWPGAWDEMPEYLRRAYEQEEMVYEIDPTDFSYGLEFLNPQELAPKLRGLSDEQLKGGAFPDLVVDAQRATIPLDVQQTQLARTLNSLSSKVTAEERNARVPTELKTEVGVTPVYETPNRAWYSLDTDGAVELEGGLMNHSIAGYSSKSDHHSYTPGKKKDFAEGNIRVFSLREKDGQPRITTDVDFSMLELLNGTGPRVLDAYGYNNVNVSDEYLEELFALWKDLGVGPTSAMPDGVQGSGEQYQMYLEYDQVFNFTDAVDHIDSGLTKRIDPETGEAFIPNPDDDGFAEGGIVSLVKGGDPNKHRRNQQRGNN